MKKKLLIIIPLLFIIGIFIYLNSYYKADKSVNKYLESTEYVNVKKEKAGIYFDGQGKDNIIIFYPGAKVEYTSYSPLMYNLAKQGIDTYLLKMPFNIAFFNMNAPDNIIKTYKYDNYYLGGHSLGGVVASNYTTNHNNITGLILLASYPTKKLDNNLKLLSIYGSKDGVLNIDKYTNSKNLFPKNYKELVIEGANHANFGNYGNQNKDNKSSISRQDQQDITMNEILSFVLEYTL